MTCAQVQARLSEYLDKSLDPASTRTIESHLSSCPQCRAETDLFAECIRQIAALSEVEPPIGFAQRVIAHVKEIETKPSFWEGLFLPFLPIQATALVLIGIIAIYIFEQEPQPKLTAPPQRTFAVPDKTKETSTAPAVNQPPALSEAKTADEEPSGSVQKPVLEAGQEPQTSAVLPRGRIEFSRKRAAQVPQEVSATKPAPDFPAASRPAFPIGAGQRESDTPPAGIIQSPQKAKAAPIPVVSEPKGFSMPPGSAAPAPLDVLGGPLGPNPLASELHKLSAAPDVELIVRRRLQPSSQEGRESAGALQKSTERGSATREQTGKSVDQLLFNLRESTTPQTVWLTIPQNQYDRLKKELSVMGTIESESRTVSRDIASAPSTESPLRVLLIVLSSDDPEPARAPGPNR